MKSSAAKGAAVSNTTEKRKYNEIVERHAPRLGLNNLVTGEPCKPFVYMDYVDDGMWVHYVTYCENIRKQKRKRCLAMAKWCASRTVPWGLDNRWDKVAFYDKWKERWLELADKFKE